MYRALGPASKMCRTTHSKMLDTQTNTPGRQNDDELKCSKDLSFISRKGKQWGLPLLADENSQASMSAEFLR